MLANDPEDGGPGIWGLAYRFCSDRTPRRLSSWHRTNQVIDRVWTRREFCVACGQGFGQLCLYPSWFVLNLEKIPASVAGSKSGEDGRELLAHSSLTLEDTLWLPDVGHVNTFSLCYLID